MFRHLTLIFLVFVFCVGSVFADGSIGLTYSEVLGDRSIGLTGSFDADISDRVRFEADGQAQGVDVYNLSLDTNFVFDISDIDLKLLIANKAKGHSLDDLGREQTVGLAFSVPVNNLNFDVGVGGKNASPFSSPSAYDTLVAEGFSEGDLEGKGLKDLSPSPVGIPFKNGSTINAFVTTGFEKGIFEVDVKGVIELIGEGSKMHQVNTTIGTSGKIFDILVTTALEVGLASYEDVIYREFATVTTLGIDF